MKPVISALAGLFALNLAVQAASAHDQWTDASAIPPWVKSQCCGPSDAHRLTADQVHVVANGYRLDGYATIIREDKLLPSPDGTWWVFYRNYEDGTQSTVFCFFGPNNGS